MRLLGVAERVEQNGTANTVFNFMPAELSREAFEQSVNTYLALFIHMAGASKMPLYN